MLIPQDNRNELFAQRVIKSLQSRNFLGYYCKTKEQAITLVHQLIPKQSSITWGGSTTIRQIGLTQTLSNGDHIIYDRDQTKDPKQRKDIYIKAFDCDYYLCSANAMSEDGVLVNIDRDGNRLAAISFGPKHVIFIVGINKIVKSVDSAIERARNIAAPTNSQRFAINTPCKLDGTCHNCRTQDCICANILLTRFSSPKGRYIVIIVGESLGF